jgi:hypothetical protein
MSLRARCMVLIRSNPAFTRADVEALIRAWDEERGKEREVDYHRARQLVYLAQKTMGLPSRWPSSAKPWSPPEPRRAALPPEPQPTTVPDLSEEERQQQLAFFLEVQRRWVNARSSKEFVRWLDAEIWRAKTRTRPPGEY